MMPAQSDPGTGKTARTGRKGFPRGHRALILEGFLFVSAGKCSDCGAAVLWYRTPVRQKLMPIDPTREKPHWWTCPAIVKGTKAGRPLQLELFDAA